MRKIPRSRWLRVGVVAMLSFTSAACLQLGPVARARLAGPEPPRAPLPAPAVDVQIRSASSLELAAEGAASTAPLVAGRQTVAVRRGSITETLTASGRVAGLDESALAFPALGRAETVAVKVGDVVQEGQLLIEAESKEIVRQLNAARARLQVSSIRLQQLTMQAQVRVRDSELELRRAQAELDRVRAGSPSERRAAQEAVSAAQAGLTRAEAEHARASGGATDLQIRAAEQQLRTAQLALQRAEADRAILRRGPDPNIVRSAEAAVSSGKAAVDRAQAELNRLSKGADPSTVASAERDVQRARNALAAAEAIKVDRKDRGSEAARDAAVSNARLALQDAEDRLVRTKQGPSAEDIAVARQSLESSRANLALAQDRLEALTRPPDQLTLDTADAAVEGASASAEEAERRLAQLRGGPARDQLAASRAALDAARAALSGAMARLAEVNSRPTAAELQEAQERVGFAQEALDRARAEVGSPEDPNRTDTPDLLLAQQAIEQDRSEVATLEADLAAARLLAPFGGVVAAVQVRAGDPLDPNTPAVVLARSGDPLVRVDLVETDGARLVVGQRAVVTLDGADADQLDGSVVGFAESAGGQGRTALLQVAWPTSRPTFGATAQVAVTLQQKDNVLLIPQRAVRTSGARRYVEYLDGTTRRPADVMLGIGSGGEVEVIGGVREGQLVLVGL